MAKIYTAKEMREFANYNDAAYARNPNLYSSAVSAALRQAADLMEREEKREKKYEYSAKCDNGTINNFHFDDLEGIRNALVYTMNNPHVVRREVSKWEEVNV